MTVDDVAAWPPPSPPRGSRSGRPPVAPGPAAPGSGDPNTLEVWTRSDPDSAATYDRVFAAFTKKTGIKIDYQPVVNFDQQLQAGPPPRTCPTS